MKKLFFLFLLILPVPTLVLGQITVSDTLQASLEDEFGDGSLMARARVSKGALGLRSDQNIYETSKYKKTGVVFELYKNNVLFKKTKVDDADITGENYDFGFKIEADDVQGDWYIKATYAYEYCTIKGCTKIEHVDQSVNLNFALKGHNHYVYDKIFVGPISRKCDGSYIISAALHKIDYIGGNQNPLFCPSWTPGYCDPPFNIDYVTWFLYKDNILQTSAIITPTRINCDASGYSCATFSASATIPANAPGNYQLKGRFAYAVVQNAYYHLDYTEPVVINPLVGGITYCAPSSVITAFTPAQGFINMDSHPRYMADVNGDGKSDVVGMGASDIYVSLSNSTSNSSAFGNASVWLYNNFTQAQGWVNNEIYPRYLSDVTGDGKADIVGFSSNGVYVAVSNGNFFNTPSVWVYGFDQAQGWSTNNVYYRVMADVNGDGKNDIVGFAQNGVYVSLSTGSSFSNYTQWLNGSFCPVQGWNDNNIYPRFLVDMNNDGKKDIVGFGNSSVFVSLSTGSSFAPATAWLNNGFCVSNGFTEQYKYPRFVRDMDGDNKPDIVGCGAKWLYMSKNNGTSFGTPYPLLYDEFTISKGFEDNNANPRWIANIDGDAYPDIIGVGSDCGLYISKNNGNGTVTYPQVISNAFDAGGGWTSSHVFPRFLTDVDNDSRDEIVGFGANYIWVENGTCTGANAFRFVPEVKNPNIKAEEESDIFISKNYPNPFEENTTINYFLGEKHLQTHVICSDVTGHVLFNKQLEHLQAY